MDGRPLIGLSLVLAACVPSEDLKAYSEGSVGGSGAEVATVPNPGGGTENGSPSAPASSDGAKTEGDEAPSGASDGETAVDPSLDPGSDEAAGESSAVGPDDTDDGDPNPPATEDDNPGDAEDAPAEVPSPSRIRFVRLVADSAVQGPYTAVAEFNLLDAQGVLIDRAAWLASADSEELVYVGGAGASFAIDGEAASMWHTAWFQVDPPPSHPHTLQIDMGQLQEVSGFRYLGRQDGSLDGCVTGYRFFVSVDGVEWGEPAASGTLANSAGEQEVLLP